MSGLYYAHAVMFSTIRLRPLVLTLPLDRRGMYGPALLHKGLLSADAERFAGPLLSRARHVRRCRFCSHEGDQARGAVYSLARIAGREAQAHGRGVPGDLRSEL